MKIILSAIERVKNYIFLPTASFLVFFGIW